MKDKQPKEEKTKAYDAPVTRLELHQELNITKMELYQELKLTKLELKQEISEVKQELKQEIKLGFSNFTSEVCQQIDKINNNFEDRFKENEQAHFEMRQDINCLKTKISL